jgi:hypothetical protein
MNDNKEKAKHGRSKDQRDEDRAAQGAPAQAG